MRLRIATLALVLTAVLPAAASAQASPFQDRVTRGSEGSATSRLSRQNSAPIAVPTKEGYSVAVSFTAAVPVDPALAASYVNYLDSLPHGTELAKLTMLIADPSEVATLCGGTEADTGQILACYGGNSQGMTVPSTGLAATTPDGVYSTAYELTHEYGHHIAANRSNRLLGLTALDMGPKYWSSYELVCDRSIQHELNPTAEEPFSLYITNPGESWAETYARLTFPDQPWTFTELLKPDATALAAARSDVLTPWRKNTTVDFRMSASRGTQVFRVPLHLDGSLKATVAGNKGAKVALKVTSGSQNVASKTSSHARLTWSLSSGCRERQTEPLSFRVTRRAGAGAVRLHLSYPG